MSDRVKIASVSGQGSGSVVARLLSAAFGAGTLAKLRHLDRDDQSHWIEFLFSSEDGQGEAVLVAVDRGSSVIGGELWRTANNPVSGHYGNVEDLRRSLGFVRSIESVQETVVSADGELVAIRFEFSEGARMLLARQH